MSDKPVVFISSISSDIGAHCASRYLADGWDVFGTYRSDKSLSGVGFLPRENLFYTDLANADSLADAVRAFLATGRKWTAFMSCAAIPQPLTDFFRCRFDLWSHSIHINAIEQLRVLHSLGPARAEGMKQVIFYAGPATNSAVTNFSALAVAKIMLIKMCELLDAEYPDMNAFIVGPGWTKTKTHYDVINDPDVSRDKYEETVRFMNTQEGTSLDDIYDCIKWLSEMGKPVAGGRNFSVVHDCWGDDALAEKLRNTRDMYKMRRSGNAWRERVMQPR